MKTIIRTSGKPVTAFFQIFIEFKKKILSNLSFVYQVEQRSKLFDLNKLTGLATSTRDPVASVKYETKNWWIFEIWFRKSRQFIIKKYSNSHFMYAQLSGRISENELLEVDYKIFSSLIMVHNIYCLVWFKDKVTKQCIRSLTLRQNEKILYFMWVD